MRHRSQILSPVLLLFWGVVPSGTSKLGITSCTWIHSTYVKHCRLCLCGIHQQKSDHILTIHVWSVYGHFLYITWSLLYGRSYTKRYGHFCTFGPPVWSVFYSNLPKVTIQTDHLLLYCTDPVTSKSDPLRIWRIKVVYGRYMVGVRAGLWFQIICMRLASMIWLSIKSSNKLQNGLVIGDCGDHQSPIKSQITLIPVCYCPAWPLVFHTKFIHMIWLMIEFICTIKSCEFCDLIDDLIWLQSLGKTWFLIAIILKNDLIWLDRIFVIWSVTMISA